MTSQPYKTQDQTAYSYKDKPVRPAVTLGSTKSDSAFRTISEVAEHLGVPQHVLRFWESKFSQVRPLKRGGGRRYYRPEDVELLKAIHHLLYTQGYTIKGVQKLFREQGKNKIRDEARADLQEEQFQKEPAVPAAAHVQQPKVLSAGFSSRQRDVLKIILAELKETRSMIQDQD